MQNLKCVTAKGTATHFHPRRRFAEMTLEGNGWLYRGLFAKAGYRHLFPVQAGVSELNGGRKQVPVPSVLSAENRLRRRPEARNDAVKYAGQTAAVIIFGRPPGKAAHSPHNPFDALLNAISHGTEQGNCKGQFALCRGTATHPFPPARQWRRRRPDHRIPRHRFWHRC